MRAPPTDDAGKPTPPQPPEPGDCCQGGCERCVYDLYAEALDVYREALREWQAQQAARPKTTP
jgi:Oxidoreductase-like protein, N-terminal